MTDFQVGDRVSVEGVVTEDSKLRELASAGAQYGDPRLPDRFWSHVLVTERRGCWEWAYHLTGSGYGRYHTNGKTHTAHRFSYAALVGGLPEWTPRGLQLDHLCRVRSCVNPAHLELVTRMVNQSRSAGRQATSVRARLATGRCPEGHLDWVPNANGGGDRCRPCRDSQRAANNAERVAAVVEARRLLGLGWYEYVAQYGQGRVNAAAVIEAHRKGEAT